MATRRTPKSADRPLPVSSRAAGVARELRTLDERVDQAVSTLSDRFAQVMTRALHSWQRGVLSTLPFDLLKDGRISGSQRNLERARKLSGQWVSELYPARTTMLKAFRTAPDEVVRLASQGIKALGRTATVDVHVLDGFYSLKRDDLTNTLVRTAQESALIARKAATSQQLLSEVAVEVQEVVEAAIPVLRRQMDAALMELVQLVVLAGSTPDDVYLYSGPIDIKIRPFCLRHVGRVFSRKAIDRMDNGQLPNTFLTRGGYNCRHVWRPVTDPALVQLADTGQVVRSGWAAEMRAIQKLPNRRGWK